MNKSNQIINKLSKNNSSFKNEFQSLSSEEINNLIKQIIEKTINNAVILKKFINYLFSSIDKNIIKNIIIKLISDYLNNEKYDEVNNILTPLLNIIPIQKEILYEISETIFNKYNNAMDVNIFINRTLKYSKIIQNIRQFDFIGMEKNYNSKFVYAILYYLTFYMYKKTKNNKLKNEAEIHKIKELILSYKLGSSIYKPYDKIMPFVVQNFLMNNNVEGKNNNSKKNYSKLYLYQIYNILEIYSDRLDVDNTYEENFARFIYDVLVYVPFTDEYQSKYLRKILSNSEINNQNLINKIIMKFIIFNYKNNFVSENILTKLCMCIGNGENDGYYNIEYLGNYNGKNMYLLKFMAKFITTDQYKNIPDETKTIIALNKIFYPFSHPASTSNYNYPKTKIIPYSGSYWNTVHNEFYRLVNTLPFGERRKYKS
jgi:hypothetical protein